MLRSLFKSEEDAQPWSIARAALYGVGIGFVAALIRAFDPLRAMDRVLPLALDIGVAVLTFALLCVAAALLRNLLVRRLCGIRVGPDQTNRSKSPGPTAGAS